MWVTITIVRALKKIEPSLDLKKADVKVLRLCLQDFQNYLVWIQSHPIKADNNIRENIDLIESWVGLWWAKYKERVKLLFKKPPKDNLQLKGIEAMKKFTREEQAQILREITKTFIYSGEICCSRILADSLFTKKVGMIDKKQWRLEEKINFLIHLKDEAKRLSHTRGYLVLLTVDARYYKLREYRNDGATKTL